MNKNLYFKVCSITIGSFLIIWSAAFTVFLMRERNQNQSDIPEYVAESTQNGVQNARMEHYLARTTGGSVVIYEVYANGYEKAISVPNIALSQLTEHDRASFDKGIILKTKEEMASLVEDFTS